MAIAEHIIPHIEEALGFKLYDNQKEYLIGDGYLGTERRTGRTTAVCIQLALSVGKPLNIDKPEDFSDMRHLKGHFTYSRSFFRNEFLDIREKLRTYGFPVRAVTSNRRKNL